MSFNGSGTFNINTAGQPVVTGTVISSSVFNALTADLATGLSTCITKDGQTTVTANIPMNSFKFTGLAAGTAATDSVRLGQLQAGAATLITVTGTNTYAGTMTPALSAYAAGNTFTFLVPNTNTTSCTLNIDGLGAKSITRDGTTALVAGDLVANSEVVVVYDGTQFQVLNSNSKTNFNLSGTLTVAGNTTLSGGTANGVAYLNGSKVLTTGSAFVFDGTNAAIGTTTNKVTGVSGSGTGLTVAGSVPTVAVWDVANSSYYFNLSQVGVNSYLWNIANGATIFGVNNAEQMRLNSTGLGIGTSSPSEKLSVAGNTTADIYKLRSNTSAPASTDAFVFRPADNTLAFGTASSERARINSSGNLGLGVTPSVWSQGKAFELRDVGFGIWNGTQSIYSIANAYFNGGFKYANTGVQASHYYQYQGQHVWSTAPSGTAGNAISFTQAMTLDSSGNLLVGTTSGTVGRIQIAGDHTTNGSDISLQNTNASGRTWRIGDGVGGYPGSLVFFDQTSVAARMLLDSSGNLLVGTTSTGFSNVWSVALRAASLADILINHPNTSGSGQAYAQFGYNAGSIGSITQNGTTAVAYNTSSDRRLKQNIVPAPSASDDIDAIQIVSHDWKSAPDEHVKYGVIAQDLQTVAPQAVTAGDDGDEIERAWGVDYSKLVPMLIKEIQSLRQRVAQLEVK